MSAAVLDGGADFDTTASNRRLEVERYMMGGADTSRLTRGTSSDGNKRSRPSRHHRYYLTADDTTPLRDCVHPP